MGQAVIPGGLCVGVKIGGRCVLLWPQVMPWVTALRRLSPRILPGQSPRPLVRMGDVPPNEHLCDSHGRLLCRAGRGAGPGV